MIIDSTINVKTNLKGSVEFSVSDDSAKIFSFLSNFLYKDKERSVMTELCSNALDAHKMVNKESTPIKVQLPTTLQREFRVRDFGPGLTEEQVYLYLTKYGSSSKNGSNEFIGGFGIGSKSPAAVTDTWTIISYNGGFETSYLIHVNDRGIPSITKLSMKPSSETGLEVIVPTKTILEWHNAALRVFEYYDVKPELKGASITLPNHTFNHQLDGLIMFKSKRSYYSNGYVLMNHRAYQIDFDKLGIKNIFKEDFFLPFEIGELSVSLSREDLQYDSRTIESIKQRVTNIKDALTVIWKKEVSPHTGIFEYQLEAAKIRDTYRMTSDGCLGFALAANDKLAKVVDFSRLHHFIIDLNDDDLPVQYSDGDVCKNLRFGRYGIGKHAVKVSRKGYNNPLKCISFACNDKDSLVFVLRDTKNAPSRVKMAINKGDLPNAIILDKPWYDIIPSDFKKVAASSLENVKIERKKRENRDKVESELFKCVGKHFERIKEKDLDTTRDWVYVRMTNSNTVSSIVDEEDFKFVKTFLDYGPQIIYLKPTTKVPKLAMSRMEWLKKEYERIYAKKDEIIRSHKFNNLKGMYYASLMGKMFASPQMFASVPAQSVAGEILAEINEFRTSPPDLTIFGEFDTLCKCANMLGKTADVEEMKTEMDYYKRMIRAYPMLRFIGECSYVADDSISTIVEYIKVCGK